MRNLFTKRNWLSILLISFFTISVYSQELTVRVPEDQPNVRDAMFFIKGQPTITDALIVIAEGDIISTAGFGNFDRAIKITFQGAGADKSIIRGFGDEEPMPEIGGMGRRFLQMNNGLNAGTELIFNDLTFLRWGNGDGNGGGIVNIVGVDITLTFNNCNFDQIMGEKGAITQSTSATNTVTFDNCFISNSISFDRGAMQGIIYKKGGNLIITNTTFMSNVRNVATTGTENNIDRCAKRAGVIALESSATGNLNFVMENCIFVDNKTSEAGKDTVQPMISFYPTDGTIEAAMAGNIMIGNGRDGKENDVDIYVDNFEGITWSNSGNVMNKAYKHLVDGETHSYVSAEIPECDINIDYTYTHQDISFGMDGELPEVLTDEFGVKYVGFVEWVDPNIGIQNKRGMQINTFPNPSNGLFIVTLSENVNQANYDIYTISGKLVKSGVITSQNSEIDMTGSNYGIYILKVNSKGASYFQKIIIK